MKKNKTIDDLFEVMMSFSEEMDRKFESINQQFKLCATKEDLKSCASKDDLKAVKQDLKSFATKDDLKAFATKDDLHQEIGRVISLFSPMLHKEDRKLNMLMERLVSKRVLARSDIQDLLDTHPLSS